LGELGGPFWLCGGFSRGVVLWWWRGGRVWVGFGEFSWVSVFFFSVSVGFLVVFLVFVLGGVVFFFVLGVGFWGGGGACFFLVVVFCVFSSLFGGVGRGGWLEGLGEGWFFFFWLFFFFGWFVAVLRFLWGGELFFLGWGRTLASHSAP